MVLSIASHKINTSNTVMLQYHEVIVSYQDSIPS